jgi:hypothetical protein
MRTRAQANKKQKTTEVENEYLEMKINETVERMRAFGIHNCCKCGVELEFNHYTMKGTEKGIKYYCIPCDVRRC